MTATVITSYAKLSDSELLTRAQCAQKGLTNNAYIKTEPEELTKFNANITALNNAIVDAKDGSSIAILKKNECRELVLDDMHRLGQKVNLQANGNIEVLQSSGFVLSKEPISRGVLPKPTGFKVVSGDNSGELTCSVDSFAGVRVYCFFYTEAPATEDISKWQLSISTVRKKKISGLTPGKLYTLRCAYKGTEEELIYSDPISIYVQ
jgi:hypothetical protein